MENLSDKNHKGANGGRARSHSDFFSDQDVSLEDLTVLKLMEEIMELD
jgi:hypothetical protein